MEEKMPRTIHSLTEIVTVARQLAALQQTLEFLSAQAESVHLVRDLSQDYGECHNTGTIKLDPAATEEIRVALSHRIATLRNQIEAAGIKPDITADALSAFGLQAT
jgi:hypothetical protein